MRTESANSFSVLLAQWHDFYVVAAEGAATLSGLLFVAISLNIEVIVREEKLPLRSATKQTFVLFVAVFFISLLLLRPNATTAETAWPLGIAALFGLALPLRHGYDWRRHGAARGHRFGTQYGAWIMIPVVLALGLLRVALGLVSGDADVLSLLAQLLILQLVTAAYWSWRLLVDVAHGKIMAQQEAREDGRAKGLERQIRALVRTQRAQNRRLHEQGGVPGQAGRPGGKENPRP